MLLDCFMIISQECKEILFCAQKILLIFIYKTEMILLQKHLW